MSTQTINFITWNVNGLRQNRQQKFQELQNADVVFLQETHIGVGDENIIQNYEDKWYFYYTQYNSSSKGTAILVRKTLDFKHISDEKDHCGAYVVLKCKLGGQLYTLVSVYNHETDTKTLDSLSRYLQSMTTGLLVIGGDFNTILNPFIDKKWNTNKMTKNRNHRKLLLFLERFVTSLQLVDVWRRKNPIKQDYTYYIKDTPVSRLDYFFVPEECMWRVRSCKIRDTKITDHQPVCLETNVPADSFQEDPQIQASLQLLNLKNDLLRDELFDEESLDTVSEVDIVTAVNSLQVSDTPRPDGIPVSFYKDKIQDIIPYIKMLYDRIQRGAFNCSERYFNESLKSPHDDNQHFFNVDYLIIATILARHLDDFLKPVSKGKLKDSATIMITYKTLCTQTMLPQFKDEIEEQNKSNSTLCQDFLTVENLLGDTEDFSAQKDNLLCQGCPLTPVLILSKLKCYALKLCKNLENYAIHVFKSSVIVCIPPEDLDKVNTMANRTNEEYDIQTLSKLHVSCIHKSSAVDCDEDEEKKCPESEMESEECEESDYESNGNEEKDKLMESGGRTAMYAVVTLQDSDEVMVAPSNWLSEDKKQCYWPPFKSKEKYLKAVMTGLEPSTGGKPWEKLAVLFHVEYGTYEQAKEKQAAMREKEQHFGEQRPPHNGQPRDAIAKMDKDKRRKETIGVFGKTGQGKSSLLNAILGLHYLLPSGCFGACTSVVTQVEANLTDSNYAAEIELISKEEWENEMSSTDNRTETVIERITALYGADADKKTLEELKNSDKYAEIDNFLSATKKTISHTKVRAKYIWSRHMTTVHTF
ncbi:putative 149 kDa protein [Labeo rohita]|uniref:149 kDa protein n=1 Tax=Labeo rohita TaxID=84645 RepID=A0ABQ8LS27_LABRO|nr:putative 149 kDa protein [Labeo rohita]